MKAVSHERVASYSSLTAFLVLVGAVAAVVGAVTHPVGGDAAVVRAFKLGGCAELVCRGRHRDHSRDYLPESMSIVMNSGNTQKTALVFFLVWFLFPFILGICGED